MYTAAIRTLMGDGDERQIAQMPLRAADIIIVPVDGGFGKGFSIGTGGDTGLSHISVVIVIAVAGDGGFCQYLAEVTTAVKYKMPIKAIILNNNELGKISKEQRAGGWDKWATDLVNPNFAEYADSCGALGIKVTKKESLNDAMSQLFNHPGPALMEVTTDVKLI